MIGRKIFLRRIFGDTKYYRFTIKLTLPYQLKTYDTFDNSGYIDLSLAQNKELNLIPKESVYYFQEASRQKNNVVNNHWRKLKILLRSTR